MRTLRILDRLEGHALKARPFSIHGDLVLYNFLAVARFYCFRERHVRSVRFSFAGTGDPRNERERTGKLPVRTPQSERTAGAWRRVFVRLALCRRMLREPATAEPYASLLRLASHQPNKPLLRPYATAMWLRIGMPRNPLAMFLIMSNFAEATHH